MGDDKMKIDISFFKEKSFWVLLLLIFTLNVTFTFIAMYIFALKEGVNSTGFIYNLSEYYLSFFNGIGVLFTNIQEGHILNYFISHFVGAFLIAAIIRFVYSLRGK